MTRRLRRLALGLLTLLVAGTAALVLVGRAPLDDKRGSVDLRWRALRAPLAARYEKLSALNTAFTGVGGNTRDVGRDLTRELEQWLRLRKASDQNADAHAEVDTANALEGTARRLDATIKSSDRFGTHRSLTTSMAGFAATTPPLPAIKAYNGVARAYEHDRTSLLRSPAAHLLGYGSRPVLSLG